MTTALILASGALAIFLAATVFGPQTGELVLRRWHHEYLGQISNLLGLALLKLGMLAPLGAALVVVGLWLAADDAYQHARQRWCGRPDYRSPGHQLLGLVWQWAWVRRLCAWLDSLMGAPGGA